MMLVSRYPLWCFIVLLAAFATVLCASIIPITAYAADFESTVSLAVENLVDPSDNGISNDISSAEVEGVVDKNYAYGNKQWQKDFTVTLNGKVLEKGTDYTVKHLNNENAGTAWLVLTGVGDYYGTKEVPFSIRKLNLKFAYVPSEELSRRAFTGKPIWQEHFAMILDHRTLVKGADFSVKHTNNVNPGTATVTLTGKGNYAGTKVLRFEIFVPPYADISNAEIAGFKEASYTGGKIWQSDFTVMMNDKALIKGDDYSVFHSNNIDAGTATVTITGKGSYAGAKAVEFRIKKASMSFAKVEGLPDPESYNGGLIRLDDISVTVGGRTLVKGIDYSVARSDNNGNGTASIIFTGKGNYGNAKTFVFTSPADN